MMSWTCTTSRGPPARRCSASASRPARVVLACTMSGRHARACARTPSAERARFASPTAVWRGCSRKLTAVPGIGRGSTPARASASARGPAGGPGTRPPVARERLGERAVGRAGDRARHRGRQGVQQSQHRRLGAAEVARVAHEQDAQRRYATAPVPTVSVVAPTFRRRHGLAAFVEPLLREPGFDELVMAVDGSDDGSVEWLHERGRRDARGVVLDLPNRGAGAARQAGVEAAQGDVVVLMDDDVIASPGLVAGHARHHADLEPKLVLGYMPNDW